MLKKRSKILNSFFIRRFCLIGTRNLNIVWEFLTSNKLPLKMRKSEEGKDKKEPTHSNVFCLHWRFTRLLSRSISTTLGSDEDRRGEEKHSNSSGLHLLKFYLQLNNYYFSTLAASKTSSPSKFKLTRWINGNIGKRSEEETDFYIVLMFCIVVHSNFWQKRFLLRHYTLMLVFCVF